VKPKGRFVLEVLDFFKVKVSKRSREIIKSRKGTVIEAKTTDLDYIFVKNTSR